MQITSILTTVLTVATFAGALPNPASTVSEGGAARTDTVAPFASNSKNYGSALATFDVIWWWIGLGLPTIEYSAYGKYEQCYNLPGLFAHLTGSIKIIAPTPGCWIYPAANCQGNFTVVGPKGDAIWDGDSQSFICDKPT
ncbi:hypothetical protein ONS95_011952 [Cadophora gregata]|uniref:uncharacterized protein n=1 Tax=Cadophora gregata TaxID=51156 RepID=UPI0026DD2936|nr:uncharacterized protein ONS95_011952 [Cadophora gregata]KAK0117618.1 hypothetical protein ONS95_011952 [Cadophora gregata]KAK0122669.1 hypothetical protein ONS96_009706 [Cadophora gregata f. sp. sojae]